MNCDSGDSSRSWHSDLHGLQPSRISSLIVRSHHKQWFPRLARTLSPFLLLMFDNDFKHCRDGPFFSPPIQPSVSRPPERSPASAPLRHPAPPRPVIDRYLSQEHVPTSSSQPRDYFSELHHSIFAHQTSCFLLFAFPLTPSNFASSPNLPINSCQYGTRLPRSPHHGQFDRQRQRPSNQDRRTRQSKRIS